VTIAIEPGIRKDNPAEPAATRELLKVLGIDARQAASILGASERDVALLLTGAAHVAGPQANKRTGGGGAWAVVAETLTVAVQQAGIPYPMKASGT